MNEVKKIVIILITGMFLSCEQNVNEKVSGTNINEIENIPDVILFDFSYKYTREDEPIWILYSQNAEVFRDEDLIKVNGVHLVFYKNQKEDTILDSKFGEVKQREKKLTAISNVILKTSDGSILTTELLYWDDKLSKLYTDEYVKISRANGDVIEGIGMEAYNNLEKLIIKQQVKGVVYEKK